MLGSTVASWACGAGDEATPNTAEGDSWMMRDVDDGRTGEITGGAGLPSAARTRTAGFANSSAAAAALADALIDEHVIGVAAGIVAVQRRQTPREALDTLVRIAHRTDRSVVEVARHLVARHSHPVRPAMRGFRSVDGDLDPAA